MDKYKIVKTLGDGMFGSVKKAIEKTTNKMVAIKKMKRKYVKWDDVVNLPEVKSLIKLSHPNIVKLIEVIKSDNELYFVFEYLDQNVYQLMSERKSLMNETQIRNIIYQTLQALAFMHRQGYFHRDLKPENLLEYKSTVKVADFGLAKEITAKPPYTEYVSTRWYRAPEVILRALSYNAPIDMFAVGAIMAELYRNLPLFPGASEADQINKICAVLGTPSEVEWPDGYKIAAHIGFKFPRCLPQSLKSLMPSASDEAIDLMEAMLRFNPQKRISAVESLQHPFFQCKIPIPKSVDISTLAKKKEPTKKEDELVNPDKQIEGFESQIIQQQKSNQLNNTIRGTKNISGFYMRNARYKPGVDSIAVSKNSSQF